MAKTNSMRPERAFKFGVNHRRSLEAIAVDADRRRRKGARKTAQPPRNPWDRSRQDD